MKIYTKKGDTGKTGLFGGTRLSKSHIRIEAYGTIDELNAHIGLLRDQIKHQTILAELLSIQNTLFDIGAHLASTPKMVTKVPVIDDTVVLPLEQSIDKMEEALAPLTSFLLPGGHQVVSLAHITRTVCRRAERRVVQLSVDDTVDPILIRYLNRLSDYFFVLSRYFAKIYEVEEIKWTPKKNKT